MEFWSPRVGDVFLIKPFGVDGIDYIARFWKVVLIKEGRVRAIALDDSKGMLGQISNFNHASFSSNMCVKCYNIIYA